MKTLLIDNYDSYSYNLYHMIGEITGQEPIIIKNDDLDFKDLESLEYDNIIISSGAGDYKSDFGLVKKVIKEASCPILVLGVIENVLYSLYDGEIIATETAFGKQSQVSHDGKGIFEGLEQNFKVARYHSFACQDRELEKIEISARSEDGVVMAIRHKVKDVFGLQFELDSISSENGYRLLRNFYRLTNSTQPFVDFDILEGDFKMEDLFDCLALEDKNPIWLDSSKLVEGLSRFSILASSSPMRGKLLKYYVGKKLVIEKANGESEQIKDLDIFEYLKRTVTFKAINYELPFDFQLGYVGYFGYELKGLVGYKNKYDYKYPDAYLKYSDRALVYDHLEKKLYILSMSDDLTWRREIREKISQFKVKEIEEIEVRPYPRVKFNRSKEEYIDLIHKCQDYIKEGKSYGICLTNRLEIEDSIEPVSYYKILREVTPGPYSALVKFDELALACSSMERFIKVDRENMVESKPIKGTVRRGENLEEDMRLIDGLKNDKKTKEENLMVVDSLRGDFGPVCKVGSVKVTKLLDVESYATVHQLISTIRGQIKDGIDVFDVIKSCIPGGSMTGVPKRATLSLLDDMENYPRGAYSGSIGYISDCGLVDLNIVIRTAVIEEDFTSIGVGGAIIDGSNAEDEFDEILLKAKGVLTALRKYYKGNFEEEIPIINSGETCK